MLRRLVVKTFPAVDVLDCISSTDIAHSVITNLSHVVPQGVRCALSVVSHGNEHIDHADHEFFDKLSFTCFYTGVCIIVLRYLQSFQFDKLPYCPDEVPGHTVWSGVFHVDSNSN